MTRLISGVAGGRRLKVPRTGVRPTGDRAREALFNPLKSLVELRGASVLDLYAGSGALGLEALSRGAASCVFVEAGPPALKTLRANVDALGAGPASRIVRTDAVRFAAGLGAGDFDVAFADPPYGQGFAEALARAFAVVPFAALLCIEHGRGDVLPALDGAQTRRYGDTSITFIPAP
jgi:16S rRNA (guanine966-N2)-methyltransferase